MRGALLAAAIPVASAVTATAGGEGPELGLPLDCTVGEDCYIQHYVDRDPGPGARDFRCGTATYDGHKGTDIGIHTIADMIRGVRVFASAPGIVVATRDGMEDVAWSPANAERVKGRECGNGVLIRHANGWETQYCHMRRGSVTVKKGERVARGDVLGLVGMSGKAQFPHVHLSVRHDGQLVDPFDASSPLAGCGQNGKALWQEDRNPGYVPGGLIYSGFSTRVPEYAEVKAGSAARRSLAPVAGALVLFTYAFDGKRGDVIRLQIDGPQGQVLSQNVLLEKDQAQFFRAAGKRLRAARWPAGTYTGTVVMMREGRELDRQQVVATVE